MVRTEEIDHHIFKRLPIFTKPAEFIFMIIVATTIGNGTDKIYWMINVFAGSVMLMTGLAYLKYHLRHTDGLESCMYLVLLVDVLMSITISLEIFMITVDEAWQDALAWKIIA